MKFLKLEILNMASLDRQDGEVIDFESGVLKDSTIFSIVGPMGAGKSTLLDAICLALYNRAPRYPRKKREHKSLEIFGDLEEGEKNRLAPTDCRNILTRGKKHGYSKLTFLANNGIVYRAEWHVFFKEKKYGDTITELYKLTFPNGQPQETKDDWETLPQIIGLDYEQFLRTVLIAQGSFASFLTAKEEERYELLEKITGCKELYDSIAKKIKSKKEEAVKAFEVIDAQYAALGQNIVPTDALPSLRDKIKELEEEEKSVKEELYKVNEALRWFAEDLKQQQDLLRFSEDMTQAEKALEAAKPDFERLALHDATLQAVAYYRETKEAAQKIEAQHKTLTAIHEEIEKKSERIKNGDACLKKLHDEETAATQELEKKKPHINQARTIKGELEAARKAVAEKEKLFHECQMAFKPYENALRPESVTQALLNEEENKIKGVEITKLQMAKSAAEQKQRDLQDAVRIREGILKKQKAQNEKADQRLQLTAHEKTLSDELDKQNASLTVLTKEVETLRNTHTLMTSENWEMHRQNLEDGKPCPLCGATHHPYQNATVLIPVLNELQTLIESKETTLREQGKRQSELNKEMGEARGMLQSIDENERLVTEELDKLQEEWRRVQERHPGWPEEVAKLEQMRPVVEQEVNDTSKGLATYNAVLANIEKYSKCLNLNNALMALSEAKALVERLAASLHEEVGDKDPDLLEQELTTAVVEVTQKLKTANDLMGTLLVSLEGLKGRREETEKNLAAENARREKSRELLKDWLDDFNARNRQSLALEDIAVISESTDNWEVIRKRQIEHNTAFTTAKTTLANEKKKHAEHQEKKPAEPEETLLARKVELENKSNRELIEAKAKMQRHEEAVRQMEGLFTQRETAETNKTEWENIAKAIGTDGKTLRKIAQCYTLRFLIAHANVEIRKFNHRYELQQVKNSLGIRVIDHDRGDDLRETTSLSGGETFIVSLGLALGLSALSSKNISFENLFIDEGFGSLDPDTLAIVLDSLAVLQTSQGKKVGVISHTNTMSEKITTQIRVIPKGTSGSSYIKIYPRQSEL